MEEARVAMGPTRALCNIIVAEPLEPKIRFQPENWEKEKHKIHSSEAARLAATTLAGLDPLHLPVAFPEVFLRPLQGFDVVVGNPPWEKVRPEHHEFWARHFPGLRGLKNKSQRDAEIARSERARPDLTALERGERAEAERTRAVIRALPGMNTGHPDLFRAFMGPLDEIMIEHG
jgi:hypothetical protein